MNKVLVVFHSRSGYTRRIAQALARRLDADIEEVKIVQPMGGLVGYALCAIEALTGLTPALRPLQKNPANYELVVIGTPVWFWSLSSPVRSWIEQNVVSHRVAFFCTMGGSGAQRVFATMKRLTGKVPVETLALTDAQVMHHVEGRLDTFAQALQKEHAASRPRAAKRRRAAGPATAAA